jgi:hypothetical protein
MQPARIELSSLEVGMRTRTLLAVAIAVVIPLACNRKDKASSDSAAAVAQGGADTGGTSDSQPPAAAATDDSVPVDVTITLSGGHAKDSGTYHTLGKAEVCQHVAAASDRVPEWTVGGMGGGGSGPGAAAVVLKVGKTTGGTTGQMSAVIYALLPDGLVSAHFIETFTGTATSGSGTVKVTPQGAGARFDLKGVDAEATSINATVICKKLSA